jgi:DnaJ-class molecular chaperone
MLNVKEAALGPAAGQRCEREAFVRKAPNHYAVLGVAQTSDGATIRAAFRMLMRSHHPDLNRSPDATSRAAEINVAFTILSDRARRAEYDAQLNIENVWRQRPQPHGYYGRRRIKRRGPVASPKSADKDVFRSTAKRPRGGVGYGRRKRLAIVWKLVVGWAALSIILLAAQFAFLSHSL